jgi:hypothetical protein
MKKLVLVTCIGILLVLGINAMAYAQSIDPAGGAHLEVNFTQQFNHVDFTVTWVTDDPNGAWPFHFGDEAEYVIVGESGTDSFYHNYAYNPGGVISYTAWIELEGWTEPWSGVITIDDRPETVIYLAYLPLITKAKPIPTCSIAVSSHDRNHYVFDVIWENAGNGVHTFNFGDDALTEQFYGSSGSGLTWHDYATGIYTTRMELFGGGSCSVKVQVNP